ncbi:NAD/NADP octopine/nopaline dehydrogenase family protein [Rummeliibacillus stabekisii]|uniref:NAD/NADP octopine/nopaline dehydrogenase family protein n=1 Tax=Rummeliibacillus stabekisii TaxID=241244 RepID=UPI00203F50CB|nr:NAD/NADP octopine/nopaline dehydrogenase family protein [Rummeliibacillus stabekisii]MCM3317871.1 NAD/NADP octopine/nopaline dehydrogenase family protein [Rummeliibacillus stabekisii]
MKITIVGSGHGGSAAAAAMAQAGHEVSMLKLSNRPDQHFEKLKETKEIKLEGIEGNGTYQLANVTNNPAAAIPEADIILIYYVSNYHENLAKALAPYLQAKQTVYICPGYLGSLLFKKEMERIGRIQEAPLFVEGETLPYSCRITSPGAVTIYSKNYGHPIAALPANRIEEACRILEPVLDNPIPRDHIVEVALHNPNLIMHTVGIAMNAAYIENSNGTFSMYTEGFTPSIWKVANELDCEKMAVLRKIGSSPLSYIDEFKVRTFTDPDKYSEKEAFSIYADSVSDLHTDKVENRYITEDVPMGLGLLYSLGRELGVPTPVANSIMTLSGIMTDSDYYKQARTVKSLGFKDASELMNEVGNKEDKIFLQTARQK